MSSVEPWGKASFVRHITKISASRQGWRQLAQSHKQRKEDVVARWFQKFATLSRDNQIAYITWAVGSVTRQWWGVPRQKSCRTTRATCLYNTPIAWMAKWFIHPSWDVRDMLLRLYAVEYEGSIMMTHQSTALYSQFYMFKTASHSSSKS